MKISKYNESQKTILVSDPAKTGGGKLVVFPTLEEAKQHLDKLKKLIGDRKPGNQTLHIVDIIKNTTEWELSKLKERYKTDELLTPYEVNVLGKKFKWDQLSLVKDPLFMKIAGLKKDCLDIIEPGQKKFTLDTDPKILAEMEQALEMDFETTHGPDPAKTMLPYHKDPSRWSREDLLSLDDQGIRDLPKGLKKELVDRALDSRDEELFKKYSPHWESNRIMLFEEYSRGEISYKKPEFEFKEFFRIFKRPELKKLLPKEIDKTIFSDKVSGGSSGSAGSSGSSGSAGFQGEPKSFELHLDPPYGDMLDTNEFVSLLKTEKLEKYIPFLRWCQKLFKGGKMQEIPLDFIKKNMDKFPNSDFEFLVKDPDYLDSSKRAWQDSKKRGINVFQKGVIKKFPDVQKAAFWGGYAGPSISRFDMMKKKGEKLPTTQMLKVGDKYHMIGGRRRMLWHIKNGIDPKIWVVELKTT